MGRPVLLFVRAIALTGWGRVSKQAFIAPLSDSPVGGPMVLLQRMLLGIQAIFWLAAGGLALTGVVDLGTSRGVRVLGVLMLGNGAALLLAALLSSRGRRLVDVATLLILAMNAVLSITDEVGALDVASLLFSTGLFIIVVYNMRKGRSR